jgi:hypothetical protein
MAEPSDPIHGFATSVVVLDTYRGPGTQTIEGGGLHITLEAEGEPAVTVIAALLPDKPRKLTAELNAIIGRQVREE